MELTADALNSFSNVLPSGFFNKISETLGIPVEKTKTTMKTAIPEVFTELQKKVRSPDGIQSVATAIHESGFDQTTSVSSDTSNVTSQMNKGQDLLNRVLGDKADSLLGKVTSTAGVSASTGSKLLGAASAAVFTFIGSKMKGGTLSPSAFANILGQGTGYIPDINLASANIRSGAEARPGISRKVWPWILLAAVIGIIWWSQGRRTTPFLSAPQVNSQSVPATQDTATVTAAMPTASDQTIMSELSIFLSNPAAVTPRTFSFRELNFQTGSSMLSTDAISTTTALATLLEQYPTTRIRIVGHTDNMGDVSANQQLSMARAESLRAALAGQGIASDRIEAAGMGSSQPVADNTTEEGRLQNRRIDVEVIRR